VARALIGHTGFVGGALAGQTRFDDFYNSANVESIAGRRYELIVCAGARAEKWRINREPEADAAELERLKAALARAEAERLLLISTVDVYRDPVGVDEDSEIDAGALAPYGRHRLELERWAAARFPTAIVRLPGLFGRGLRKNVVYDFLHDNRLEQIHADAVFQFYDLENLWADLELVLRHGLMLVNFATEPVAVRELARDVFGREFRNRPSGPPARYDFRSKHAAVFGGANGYLYDRAAVLASLRKFVAEHTRPPA